jgi:hypothetical protein
MGNVSVQLKGRPLCPWGKIPLCLLNRLGGPYNKSGRCGEKSLLVIELPSIRIIVFLSAVSDFPLCSFSWSGEYVPKDDVIGSVPRVLSFRIFA